MKFLICFLLCSATAVYAQPSGKIIARFTPDYTALHQKKECRATRFIMKAAGNLPELRTIPLYDVIKSIIPAGTDEKKVIVQIQGSGGATGLYTMLEFRNDIALLQPLLIVENNEKLRADTLRISSKNNAAALDLGALDAKLQQAAGLQIALNYAAAQAPEIKGMLRPHSLILPADKSLQRWIAGIEQIIVLQVE
jgi:hypothetical protein